MSRLPGISDISTAEAHRHRAEELEAQLQAAPELLEAIRSGEVDAVVVGGPGGDNQIYTLKDADRPYRVLIEQMREGALTISRDGVVLYANRALADLLRARPEEVVGHSFRRFVRAQQQAAFDRLLAGGKGELTLQAADRALVPVQISVSELPPDEGGGPPVLCAVVTDLSEEKRRAAELAEARASWRKRRGGRARVSRG